MPKRPSSVSHRKSFINQVSLSASDNVIKHVHLDVALIRNNPQRRRRSDVSRRGPCRKVKAKIARAQLPRNAECEQRPSPGFPRWKRWRDRAFLTSCDPGSVIRLPAVQAYVHSVDRPLASGHPTKMQPAQWCAQVVSSEQLKPPWAGALAGQKERGMG